MEDWMGQVSEEWDEQQKIDRRSVKVASSGNG